MGMELQVAGWEAAGDKESASDCICVLWDFLIIISFPKECNRNNKRS